MGNSLKDNLQARLVTLSGETGGGIYMENPTTGAITTIVDENGNIDAPVTNANVTVTDTLTVSGREVVGQSARSGAGAVPITAPTCLLTTTGANALTLADGAAGQRLRIIMIVDGGDGTLTPTTKTGYSTITFNDASDSVDLEFCTTYGWIIVGSRGVTIA
jgi:hypothetical protein